MSGSDFSKGNGPNCVRVLIVDDDPGIRTLLTMYLARKTDFKVVGVASNGVEGVELSGLLQPQVVMMDYMMPVMDGLTATRLIRTYHPEIQVVMLSASLDPELKAHALEAGVSACLPKLSLDRELLDSIRTAACAGQRS